MAHLTLADRARHILDAIAKIETFTAGKTFDDCLADDMRRHAIERCLEIVSEASRHIPREVRARHPEIAWRGVADFGNVLRHDYPNVKDRRVWQIVTHDLGPLKAAVTTILRDLEATGSEPPVKDAR
jgi:uncharacterized protein with HEPN domain